MASRPDHVEESLDDLALALGGELSPLDAAAVMERFQRDPELRREVDALSELAGALPAVVARDLPGAHVTVEDLLAYMTRRLPAAESQDLEGHLASCPDCAALLRQLAGFLERYEEHLHETGQGIRCRECRHVTPRTASHCSWCRTPLRVPLWRATLAGVCGAVPVGAGAGALVIRYSAPDAWARIADVLGGDAIVWTLAGLAVAVGVSIWCWPLMSRHRRFGADDQ